MKNYQKPQVEVTKFQPKETISSLADWLDGNEMYGDAVITTYLVES